MPAVNGKKRDGSKSANREDEQNRALSMWMQGLSQREIAKELGVSQTTTHRRIQDALDSMRPHADYDRYRGVQLGELEISRKKLRKVIATWEPSLNDNGSTDVDALVKTITTLVKLQEREAKLLGLDRVPTPFDEVAMMSDADIAAFVAECAAEVAASE